MPRHPDNSRRSFLKSITQIAFGAYAGSRACRVFAQRTQAPGDRPAITSGAAVGEVTQDGAVLWSRTNRAAKMLVEVSSDQTFANAQRIAGPDALATSDFTAKLQLQGLAPESEVFYRVYFQDLAGRGRLSEPVEGRLRTAPSVPQDIRFLWSGDTAGQGFGIDESRGGMLTYETMRRLQPDFFVHSGDTCYADGPFPKNITLDDGSTWSNLTTEATSKVAETLAEFRANHRYNLLDEHVRRFNADVPIFVQWDDHETTNNWYPGEQLDERYNVKSASLLAARAKQAFFEYYPIPSSTAAPQQVHRVVHYGPLLDLFFLDMRTFRGPNTKNDQVVAGPQTRFLGEEQLSWLRTQLAASNATWKVICSDMPLGMIVGDGKNFENSSNGDGPPRGRELEIAGLLRFIKQQSIQNTVWITADVHHAASHYYDPNAAVFNDFLPFWEFVSGPIHAGTFGPSKMDNTFGPQVRFRSLPDGMQQNRPPSDGLQFFGMIGIDGATRALTVTHYNRAGDTLWNKTLDAKLT